MNFSLYESNDKTKQLIEDKYFEERKELLLNPKSHVKFDVHSYINYEYFRIDTSKLYDITDNAYNEYKKKNFKKGIVDDYPSFFVKVYLIYMLKRKGSIPNINEYSEDCCIKYFYEQIHQYLHKYLK